MEPKFIQSHIEQFDMNTFTSNSPKKKNERKLKRRRRRKKKIKKKRRSQIKKILFSNAVNFNSNICLFMYRMIIMNS